MSLLPFSFAAPMVLWGLLALPAIWWLLRLTPPRPQEEVFPPLAILAKIIRRDDTPNKSPWWLTLLRLLLAALVIFALADPVFNPRERVAVSGKSLAIVLENSWATAPDWDRRVATATRLIEDARDSGTPVILALTAESAAQEIGPFEPATALEHLNAAEPRPIPPNRPAIFGRVAGALAQMPGATLALLTDGLAAPGDAAAFRELTASSTLTDILWFEPETLSLVTLIDSANEPERFTLRALRREGESEALRLTAFATDGQGRRIAETSINFGPDDVSVIAEMRVPFELRNDFASLTIEGQNQAGAVRLLDENSRRRRVGLISQSEADQAQPLLSPLYYIRRALAPFADLVEPSSLNLAEAVPELLAQQPAVIVMADIGTLPQSVREPLIKWVESGGTLLRFAGPRLAAAEPDEELLPVRLRTGERSLGGALSWSEPQAVTEFPAIGPFAGLTPPHEVTVTRQVLAQPSADIAERTWANLADGTPLVTGASRGAGRVILFHITPEATWSNLPISGSFVEMLRRIVQLSRNQGSPGTDKASGANLPPYRMISAHGAIVPPGQDAEPLASGPNPAVTLANPPGLYGSQEGFVAHNLLNPDAKLARLERPQASIAVTQANYAFNSEKPLKGWLMAAALLLLALDSLAVIWLGGWRNRGRNARATLAGFVAIGAAFAFTPTDLHAQVADTEAIDAITSTRIGYVVTGVASVDATTRAGLLGLNNYLAAKTALEPGAPAPLDLAVDELSFYPLIYWPIDANAQMPSEQEIARIDAYMQQGGTVLFDTRDQYSSGFSSADTVTPETQRLREILSHLNVPPLEPVPEDHVLTKTFFIMNQFPGRYAGSELWVQASMNADNREDRPVRVGDGVTPIMITANDFAGAWAIDANGETLLPTIPADPMQRIYAYRAGVNIVMYMLTGNYKSDQVHVPALLERLGQ